MTRQPYSSTHYVISLAEMAYDLNVNRQGLRKLALSRNVPLRKRRVGNVYLLFTTQDGAAILRNHHEQNTRDADELTHWLTGEQAARALGLTLTGLLNRRRDKTVTIQQLRLRGKAGRGAWRYNPDDVNREARRLGIHPQRRPQGALVRKQVADILKVTECTVSRWVTLGMPHGRLMRGYLYFDARAVLAWLDQPMAAHTPEVDRKERQQTADLMRAWLCSKERAA